MACLILKSDSAVFVPRGDPSAVDTGKYSPDPDWYCAEGQPADCTRVRVRSLTAAEVAGLGEWPEAVHKAARIGFVDLNGKPANLDADFADGTADAWKVAIGLLVLAVTHSPLTVRPFRWMASPSTGTDTPAP